MSLPILRLRPYLSYFSLRLPLPPSLPLALCAALTAMPAIPALGAEDSEDKQALPAVEVRGARSYYDPRPGAVSTATRTATDVRDVPQTIDVVNVQDAAAYGARTLAGALAGVPGVSSNSDTRFDSFKIRGFSSVGDLFLDGIRDDAQYVRSLGNIERVEILKGPAAVLYGRGSGGGVINRISKQPGMQDHGRVGLQAGSYGSLGVTLDLDRALSPEWGMRVNAGRERAGSFRDGIDSRRHYVAPSLKWSDGHSSWLLQAELADYRRTPDRGMPAGRHANGDYFLPPAALSTTYGMPGRDFIDDRSVYLRSTLEHRLGPQWKLRQVLGMLDLRSSFDNTYATGLAGPGYGTVTRQRWQQDMHQRNWQGNLELEGNVDGVGGLHQLLLGAEYTVQRRQPILYRSAFAGSVPLLAPSPQPESAPPALTVDSLHRAGGLALYAQDQLKLSPAWTVLGGMRWDHFAVDSTNRRSGDRVGRTTKALSPRLGVVWHAHPAHNLYGSYSKNFIPSGGSDAISLTPGGTSNVNDLPPQFSRQVELGVKSDWFDQRISTTLSVFQLDLYNRRVRIQQAPDLFVLTGLERNRGIELGVNGELATNWFIRSGFSVQRARILKSSAIDGHAGKRSSNVAGANGSLFISHAPVQGWFGELGLVYEGSRYVDLANRLDMPAYVRWDGKLGVRHDQAELTLAVTNIGNRRYYASSTSLTQIMPGAPRSFLLSLAYGF